MLLTVIILFSNVFLFHCTTEEERILSSIIVKRGIGIKEHKENIYRPLLEPENAYVAKRRLRRSGKEDAQKVNHFFGKIQQTFKKGWTEVSDFFTTLGR